MSPNNMNNPATVQEQYSTGNNLNTRRSIHDKYSTNPMGFGNWIHQQYHFFDGCRILELGCGTGNAWVGKLTQIGNGSTLVLSDLSQGMVQEVKRRFSGDTKISFEQINFEQINIEDIPYDNDTFDFVIANMMLHHVPDLNKGLREVGRVLKAGGTFYGATFGENGIQAYLTQTLSQYGIRIDINGVFTLQNGNGILKKYFNRVNKTEYIDSLEVTDTNDLLDYIYSMTSIGDLEDVKRKELFQCFEAKKDKNGILPIPKEYGMFIAMK